MVLLALMVLQNTATVLVGRYTRSGGGGDLYVVNHLIVVCEATKVRGESALLRWFGAPSFLTYIHIRVHYLCTGAVPLYVPANLRLTAPLSFSLSMLVPCPPFPKSPPPLPKTKNTKKFFLACVLEFVGTRGALYRSLHENVLSNPLDALKITVPSLLYLVQNSLLYVALSNLSAPMFQVTYQAKLLTTAVVSVLMLNRRYSAKQWTCLTVLGMGVAIVVLGAADGGSSSSSSSSGRGGDGSDRDGVAVTEKAGIDGEEGGAGMMAGSSGGTAGGEDGGGGGGPSAAAAEYDEMNLFTGLAAVTVACLSSALAGVYFEMVLKKPPKAGTRPVSLWMRNIQMAFFSVAIGLVQYLNLTGEDATRPFLHGFTGWVWVLVLLQAGGGLLVAAVIKYADNVLKGMATGVSVVFGSLCSVAFFGTLLPPSFFGGALLVLSSVYFFSNELPCRGARAIEREMVMPMLPK